MTLVQERTWKTVLTNTALALGSSSFTSGLAFSLKKENKTKVAC